MRRTGGGVLLAAGIWIGWTAWPTPSGACSVIHPCEEQQQVATGSEVLVQPVGQGEGESPEMPDFVRVIADVYGNAEELVVGDAVFLLQVQP
jgi:hypothetical protein